MKRFMILAVLGTLAACGYQPVATQTVTTQLSGIEVANLPDRSGQQLRLLLTDRLQGSGATAPLYRLEVGFNERRRDLGLQKDATATRAQLTLRAEYKLIRLSDGATAAKGDVRSVASYNILQSPYGSLITEKDARSRALAELADSITRRLSLALKAPELERTGAP